MINKVFFTQVWDKTKNYGLYANEFFSLLPPDSWGCLSDGDVSWLTSDYGNIIYAYTEKYPDTVLSCYTNRIGCPYQKLPGVEENNHDIKYHKALAEKAKLQLHTVTDVSLYKFPLSGMVMVISKATWEKVGKFNETGGMLGVDNDFYRALQKNKVRVLLMNGLYVYHQYRIQGNKNHLL